MIRAGLFFSIMALSTVARGATVDVAVRGADGQPLTDAVVTINTPQQPAGPIHFPWPMVMAQQNISFAPHVLIVPVGATVAFPNRDKVRHHVYSFSKSKKFDIKLYGRDETRTETFDKPGVVALGCNIHDRMSGFIIVVDTPYAALADATGHVRLQGVPEGAVTVSVWSPSIRAPGNRLSQPVTVSGPNYSTTLTMRR
ncbi:methylamine utilization protein [Sphingomonas koreensis]|nr:methylamine utilization protein [Sphingomonas koreensis]